MNDWCVLIRLEGKALGCVESLDGYGYLIKPEPQITVFPSEDDAKAWAVAFALHGIPGAWQEVVLVPSLREKAAEEIACNPHPNLRLATKLASDGTVDPVSVINFLKPMRAMLRAADAQDDKDHQAFMDKYKDPV